MSSPGGIPPVAYGVIVLAVGALRWAAWRGRHGGGPARPRQRADDAEAEMRRAEIMMARRVRREARADAHGSAPQDAVAPQHPATGTRALGRVAAAMAAELAPADEVTFAQLVERARWLVIDRQDASATMLRAELGIDYDTTARVLDELERRGVVGPATIDLMPRQVLIPRGQ